MIIFQGKGFFQERRLQMSWTGRLSFVQWT